MKGKMAVLGPAGTFSESAARAYLKREGLDLELSFYPTIDETADAVGAECCCGLLPLENTLDGYVQGTLDLLLEKDFTALGEIRVPVQFALVANVRRPEEIRTVYVQFKAQGQCRHALHQLAEAQVINTHSNTQSFELVQRGIPGEGAIIPVHLLEQCRCPYVQQDVTDAKANATRFLAVKPKGEPAKLEPGQTVKMPLYVLPSVDHPGVLFEILSAFTISRINLVSIMSRPTKMKMGTYNFYLELSSKAEDAEKIAMTPAPAGRSLTAPFGFSVRRVQCPSFPGKRRAAKGF